MLNIAQELYRMKERQLEAEAKGNRWHKEHILAPKKSRPQNHILARLGEWSHILAPAQFSHILGQARFVRIHICITIQNPHSKAHLC